MEVRIKIRVKEVRESLNMSQKELAKKSGIAIDELDCIENGFEPLVSTAIRIALALKTMPEDLWIYQKIED